MMQQASTSDRPPAAIPRTAELPGVVLEDPLNFMALLLDTPTMEDERVGQPTLASPTLAGLTALPRDCPSPELPLSDMLHRCVRSRAECVGRAREAGRPTVNPPARNASCAPPSFGHVHPEVPAVERGTGSRPGPWSGAGGAAAAAAFGTAPGFGLPYLLNVSCLPPLRAPLMGGAPSASMEEAMQLAGLHPGFAR